MKRLARNSHNQQTSLPTWMMRVMMDIMGAFTTNDIGELHSSREMYGTPIVASKMYAGCVYTTNPNNDGPTRTMVSGRFRAKEAQVMRCRKRQSLPN